MDCCQATLRKVDQAIANLARAIAAAGDFDELLDELRAARAQRDELVRTIAALKRANVERFDRRAIATKVHEHLAGWRALLATKRVEDGRRLLPEVLAGLLRFTPEARTYRFEGEVAIGRLIAGAGLPSFMVAVRGIEPRFDG